MGRGTRPGEVARPVIDPEESAVMHAELSAIEQEFESALVRLHELRTKVPRWLIRAPRRRNTHRTLLDSELDFFAQDDGVSF